MLGTYVGVCPLDAGSEFVFEMCAACTHASGGKLLCGARAWSFAASERRASISTFGLFDNVLALQMVVRDSHELGMQQ